MYEIWLSLKTIIHKGISQFVPIKKIGSKRSLPWITQHIKRLIYTRDSLFQNHRSKDTPIGNILFNFQLGLKSALGACCHALKVHFSWRLYHALLGGWRKHYRWSDIFLIFQPKYTIWVLKRTVSMRGSF